MTAPPYAVLEAARTQAGMSFRDLWIGYLAVGGCAVPHAVRAYLRGRAAPPAEYDMIAQAINDRFVDAGGNHPVPYRDELA